MIVSAFSALGLQGNDIASSQFWLFDSAASNHMTNSSSMLKNDQVLGTVIAKGPKVGRLFPLVFSIPNVTSPLLLPGFVYERRQPTLLLPETDLPPAPASEPTSEISSELGPPEPILRRSTRVSRPLNWYGFSATLFDISVPSCYSQASKHECW
ncbi:hypothetical protein GH714_025419 [Hevea brasiliensis]|uniref:Uncharacterized protein n=1 Tax=Hevea brasiliensis TaxID=3981 RepID=A0A6A6NJ52_HEVBR|nr:hypothetical protein GH714_025419 [Hevea brasiliensis]